MTFALEAKHLSIAFGGLKAVADLSIAVPPHGLYGLIGPNGAGKTTAFNLLTGVYQPGTGDILLGPRRLNGLRPSAIAQAGLARTFQNIRLFGELSVLDNVRTAAGVRAKSGLWRSLLRTPRYMAEENAIIERSLDLLDVLGIAHRAGEQAKSLPYGDQRRLEIARALATDHAVLRGHDLRFHPQWRHVDPIDAMSPSVPLREDRIIEPIGELLAVEADGDIAEPAQLVRDGGHVTGDP